MLCLSLLLWNRIFLFEKYMKYGERTVFRFHYLIRRGIDSLQSLLFVHRYILYYDLLSRIDKKS